MKVILLQDVEKLGKEDDIVNVKPGYARNYLIPKKLAILSTDANIRILQEKQKIKKIKEEKEEEKEKKLINRLEEIILKVKKRVTEEEKLYGGVTPTDIMEQLAAQYNIIIDRKNIEIGEPIKEIGKYNVVVKFSKGKFANLKIEVEKETEI